MATFFINLPTFSTDLYDQQVTTTIENTAYNLLFQNNIIENTLFLTCFGRNNTPIFFGSYRCVFGNYINLFDNGLPYVFFFIDESNNGYTKITFDALNNGVRMYANTR